jgi:hypothetical protein
VRELAGFNCMAAAAMGVTSAQLLLPYSSALHCTVFSEERRNAEAMNNNDATYVVVVHTATDAAIPSLSLAS